MRVTVNVWCAESPEHFEYQSQLTVVELLYIYAPEWPCRGV